MKASEIPLRLRANANEKSVMNPTATIWPSTPATRVART